MAYDLVRNDWLPLRYLVGTILASATIVIGYGIAEHFGLVPHLPGVNPPPGGTTSTLGDYHELASYLGLIVILALCLFAHAPTRLARLALVVFIGSALFVLFWTGTRSEYISLFLVLLGLAVWRPTRRPAIAAAVFMVVVFISPIVGFLLFPPPGLQQAIASGQVNLNDWGRSTTQRFDFAGDPLAYSLGERFYLKWPRFIEAAMRNPIIGLGPSAAGEAVDGYYLRALVESGIVGLLAFITVLATVFSSAFRGARRARGVARSLAVVALSVTAFVALVGVLIDTWVASRVMDLYWPLIGAALAAVAVQNETSVTSSAVVGNVPAGATSGA